MRLLLTKLVKRKAPSKTGNKCVFQDGHGSGKLYHTTHHLMLKPYQVKHYNMESKVFQNLKIDLPKLSKNNI